MTAARRALPDVLAAGGIALAIWLFFGHAFLNYDSFYALVWGDELVHGESPGYEVSLAPTPHPLAVALGAALSPLGDGAEAAFLALVLLAVGALCVGLFRLGAELFAWPVGLVAAAIVATRVPVLDFGVRGYVDLPAAALIVWAAVLEVRRPRRGAAVLVLLAIAGLLRPEAWLFAAVYWLWVARGHARVEQARLAALAMAAPVLWALSDLLVTGDPFWSLTGTTDLAETLQRNTGVDGFAELLPRRLGEILRLPELIAAVLGFAAGYAWLRERTLLPTAVAALNGVGFLVFAIAGLPLLTRYLFVAGAMLALFAGVAVFGWLSEETRRPAWRAGGLAILAVLIGLSFMQAGRLGDLREDIRDRDRVFADLHDLADESATEAALGRCGNLGLATAALAPRLEYWIDRDLPEPIPVALGGSFQSVALVLPRNAEVARLARLDPNEPGLAEGIYEGAGRVRAENRSWRLYADC